MAKLIENTTLPADFIDGQILYGGDINKIISVVREGVNVNWAFNQTIIGGNSEIIYTESYSDLLEYVPFDGTYGYVIDVLKNTQDQIISINHIGVYKYDTLEWKFLGNLSLVWLFDYINQKIEKLRRIHYETLPVTAEVDDLFIDYDE